MVNEVALAYRAGARNAAPRVMPQQHHNTIFSFTFNTQ
jgi:hypothetical protein